MEAKFNLGLSLSKGRGVNRVDHEQAVAQFREAIEGGSIRALYQMGAMHSRGHGVEQNSATAVSYWQRAADQGHTMAAREIGYAYWKGEGGYEVNFKLAKKYTRASAAQGNEDAIADLKEMTACAQCGTGSAPGGVCAGCKQVHYCSRECQLLHWRDPVDPHMLHCSSCRTDDPGASPNKSPCAEKKKSDRACAACGATDAKMLCSDCLYEGDAPLEVRWGPWGCIIPSTTTCLSVNDHQVVHEYGKEDRMTRG